MIAEAYIAAQLGRAIYRVDDRYFIMGIDDAEEPRSCHPHDVARLREPWIELTTLPAKNLDVPQIRRALRSRKDAYDALSLTISGFDPALRDETRSLCIEAAETLMHREAVRAFARNRLCARPLPDEADLAGGIALAEASKAMAIRSIYEEIAASQNAIPTVLEAWEAVAPDYFASPEEQAEGERALIERGVMADMAAVIAAGNLSKLDGVVMTYGIQQDFKQAVPQGIRLINALKTRILEQLPAQREETPALRVEDPFEAPSAEQSNIGEADIRSLIFKIRDKQTKVRGKRKPGRSALTVAEAMERINSQIEAIETFIQQRDTARIYRRLHQLLEFQLKHSDKEHVAKTLCSLAKTAIDANAFDTAAQWVDYAIDLSVEDVVIWSTQAMMFKEMGRLQEALDLYQDTSQRFPTNVVAQTGRAEVLKEMGRLQEALDLYVKINHDFPTNVVALNGRAEVLKGMGRLQEALDLYVKINHDFPTNVVALNGRAEVLKGMGRLQEALDLYVKINRDFPNDVVALNGRAEVLKEMGRLQEALDLYVKINRDFPNDVVAQTGRAEVLKGMGRLQEALDLYVKINRDFPNDVVAQTGRASLLVSMGRYKEVRALLPDKMPTSRDDWINYHILAMSYLKAGETDEAIERLSYGIEHTLWQDVQNYFVTALGVAQMMNKRFEEVVETLQSNITRLHGVRRQTRLLILSHAQAELKQEAEARQNIAALGEVSHPRILDFRRAVVRRYGLNGETDAPLTEDEAARLDRQIEESEFLLALAA